MSDSLENAPLVELIAEVRWQPSNAIPVPSAAPNGVGPSFVMPSQDVDEFFMRFGASMFNAGCSETERLVPSNFPLMMHQPVYRFKAKEHQSTKTLYQAGLGLFSANAIPPYESWKTFGPVVRRGLEILIGTRSPAERDLPFTATSLRYLDAFSEKLTEGRSVDSFVRDVFGIKIDLPKSISQHLVAGSDPKPAIQLQIPMASGLIMNLAVGEGMANGKQSIVMDTSVVTTLPLEPTPDAVMKAFDAAHEAIDRTFRALIEPISHLMPKKTNS